MNNEDEQAEESIFSQFKPKCSGSTGTVPYLKRARAAMFLACFLDAPKCKKMKDKNMNSLNEICKTSTSARLSLKLNFNVK